MKSINKRWYAEDKRKAVRTIHKLYFLLPLALAVGFVISTAYHTFYIPMQQQKKELQSDLQIISQLIQKHNPKFEPVYIEPVARYIIENSGNYDPVWLVCIALHESGFNREAKSNKGAEGFWQIKPHGKEYQVSLSDRFMFRYQLEKAKERLDGFYKKGYCIVKKQGKKSKRICGIGKQTIYGMHRGYIGSTTSKSKPQADAYIAKIYCEYAEARRLIWKKLPQKEKRELPQENKKLEKKK